MSPRVRNGATTGEERHEARGPAAALVHRWPLALAMAVVGGVVGVGAASTITPTYTAEARVAVGYGDLNAGAITGFPTAAESLASNYARYVRDQGMAGQLPQADSGAYVQLSATPIPDSNVIRIFGASSDREAAAQAVQTTADGLVETVNNPTGPQSPQQLRQNFDDAALSSAQATSAVDEAKAALATALADPTVGQNRIGTLRQAVVTATAAATEADLDRSAAQSQYLSAVTASRVADLLVIADAAVIDDDSSARTQRYGLIGVVLGVALALVLANLLERRSTNRAARRRGEPADGAEVATDVPAF